jgi:hypothetical protein
MDQREFRTEAHVQRLTVHPWTTLKFVGHSGWHCCPSSQKRCCLCRLALLRQPRATPVVSDELSLRISARALSWPPLLHSYGDCRLRRVCDCPPCFRKAVDFCGNASWRPAVVGTFALAARARRALGPSACLRTVARAELRTAIIKHSARLRTSAERRSNCVTGIIRRRRKRHAPKRG